MRKSFTKINISSEAELALERMLSSINAGFDGGRVTKQAVVSWILIRFEQRILENYVESIREDHFDEVAYLAAKIKELKSAQRTGRAIEDMDSVLAPLRRKKRRASAANCVEKGG